MDAEGSTRWSPAQIIQAGGIVCQSEWSDLLNQNRFYKFGQRTVTTDSNGLVSLASLNSGSGDSAQYFYRLLSLSDANYLYRETDFNYVPMATVVGFQSPFEYLYYYAGDNFQVLPVQSNVTMTAFVNWTPPTIAQLAGDDSVITFPSGYELVLVWVTAATLLMKGAAESQAASDLLSLASDARRNMQGDIARRTTRPTFAVFQDSAASWGP